MAHFDVPALAVGLCSIPIATLLVFFYYMLSLNRLFICKLIIEGRCLALLFS